MLSRSNSNSNSTHQDKKITRSNLVEQLREYQIRTKHDWASISLFSPNSNLYTSRQLKLAIVLATITLLLLLCMKVTKHVKLARKKKRRMLLPLSM